MIFVSSQSVSHDPPGVPQLLSSSSSVWAWFLRLAGPFVKAGRNEIQSNTQSGHTIRWLCGPMTVLTACATFSLCQASVS